MMARWDGEDLAAYLSSALVPQVSADIVLAGIPLSQSDSSGGFCRWPFGGKRREVLRKQKTRDGFSQRDMFDYGFFSMWKVTMFEVFDAVSSFKLLMSLTSKGFITVPGGSTVWVAFHYTQSFQFNLKI